MNQPPPPSGSQPPPPTGWPTNSPPPAHPYASQPRRGGLSTGAKVAIGIPVVLVGGFVALMALAIAVSLLGLGSNDDIASDIDGAEVVAVQDNLNGSRTTWWILVDDDASPDEIEVLATELVSLPDAAEITTLDMIFVDDDGRRLDEVIDALDELDEISNGDDIDVDRVLELSQELASGWVAEHTVASLSPDETASTRVYHLCARPIGETCDLDERVTIEPN